MKLPLAALLTLLPLFLARVDRRELASHPFPTPSLTSGEQEQMNDLIERLENPRLGDWIAVTEQAAARIKELEAERDEWKATAETCSMIADVRIKAERDAIEVATVEKCASRIEKLGWTAAANSIREMKAETIK